MGHCVAGLVGPPQTLSRFASKHLLGAPVVLAQGLRLLPLRDHDIDAFLVPPLTGFSPSFTYLCEQLVQAISRAADMDKIMYFETEYFAGMGGQGAAVYGGGSCLYQPRFAIAGPINEALRVLGVRVEAPASDEFESIGLHWHRSTEDWLERGNKG
jgi:hypothetical protein